MGKTYDKRNPYVKAAYAKELDLSTRSVKPKTQYKRKPKHIKKVLQDEY